MTKKHLSLLMLPLLIGSSTAWAASSSKETTEAIVREAEARAIEARAIAIAIARAIAIEVIAIVIAIAVARAIVIAIAIEAKNKTYKNLTSFLIGSLVLFNYFYHRGDQSDAKPSEEEGDSTRADALENESSDARSPEEKKNSIPTSEKVIKHSPDVGQDKKVAPSISSSIGIYPLLFTLIVLGGLYLFLYRDFYFSALPQPAAVDDVDSAEGDVLSGEEGEATPQAQRQGSTPSSWES